ncbi:hypothetical protein LX87_03766 [Larkinella arboricola]|uniref:Uncharacterized protein n=1 Tax=Larkinella arboricola TaxID=643671 RepID=A0A327WWE8_LARAB|nr:hypothetical protein LX87_03766 [Larkinella arboricola]
MHYFLMKTAAMLSVKKNSSCKQVATTNLAGVKRVVLYHT